MGPHNVRLSSISGRRDGDEVVSSSCTMFRYFVSPAKGLIRYRVCGTFANKDIREQKLSAIRVRVVK